MIKQVEVYYHGWGEHWLWGTLFETHTINQRPVITFEYSDVAIAKGVELCAHLLPLGQKLHTSFPAHQLGLPGPVYDALPDGWGMLLMDRLFKRQGLDVARVSPLQRLCYIADSAMGALSFQPVIETEWLESSDVSLLALAQEVEAVQKGDDDAFLVDLLKMGGSPQGARPKLLLHKEAGSTTWSNMPTATSEAWLVKFPAYHEHPEVCAIERLYAHCLMLCGIDTPESAYIGLPGGLAAFASKRFDRLGTTRIPMQTLAAFTGADYRAPGSLDYKTFLRATFVCTRDARQKRHAFERAVFNVVFNNRDDHPKNVSYVMDKRGTWALAPAYDVTFCDGPGGYHQMDVMGEALDISQKALVQLGVEEAELTEAEVLAVIEKHCRMASRLRELAQAVVPNRITHATLQRLEKKINNNIALLN